MTGKILSIASIAAMAVISCSNSDTFRDENLRAIKIDGVSCINANISPSLADIYYYFWIINGDTIHDVSPKTGFGEHSVKLVLIDAFGDSVSDSISCRINEPLKIELLAPIDGFSGLSIADLPEFQFQYRISGVDSWEEVVSNVYISTDKDSLWKEENIFKPSLIESMHEAEYYWGVKAFTKPDSELVSSEKRRIWLKD